MSDQERFQELRHFLKARRERLTPGEVGLPATARRRVAGLRREEVAALAGIGVSWYTALENGDARGVSDSTLLAVAGALRLSDSERHYLLTLAGRSEVRDEASTPSALVVATTHAIAFPAYIIDADWDVLDCNLPFRRVWGIADRENPPFNAVERMFTDPAARPMHGERLAANIRPVIAMLRSSQGRRPHSQKLSALRERILTDDAIKQIWDEYEISSPFLSNTATIDSPIGRFSYQSLTLPIAGMSHGIVVHVPDAQSRELFVRE
jgi:transcriptional regulator with XRE-family HTH domain